MLSIYDEATAAAALAQPLDPELRTLMTSRLQQAEEAGLAELTHIVVVQPGDDLASIEHEVGFNPLVSPLDGTRYGQSAFQPFWSWLQDLGGWYELIHTVGDSGFAFILLIPKELGAESDLAAMCQEYAPCAF